LLLFSCFIFLGYIQKYNTIHHDIQQLCMFCYPPAQPQAAASLRRGGATSYQRACFERRPSPRAAPPAHEHAALYRCPRASLSSRPYMPGIHHRAAWSHNRRHCALRTQRAPATAEIGSLRRCAGLRLRVCFSNQRWRASHGFVHVAYLLISNLHGLLNEHSLLRLDARGLV